MSIIARLFNCFSFGGPARPDAFELRLERLMSQPGARRSLRPVPLFRR